ncbi:hypothetical protein LSH36_423g01000 [Paralvinella palmiformis]|uniref:Uncharacterized protein n=1 Tax=Paralvinella palmiformis TaxID=53620 RepID=A0AAD9JCB9_9ANNE|nr:hypothetical protein LSH36_423g01000 [Paralvinella palmiformis]
MTNSKLRLNGNRTDLIIIGTSRQRQHLIHFVRTNLLSHSITLSDTVRNLGVTFHSHFNFRKPVSLACRSCFYHIHDLRRIRLYISLSSSNPLLMHSLLVGLINPTLFFVLLHLRIF